MTPIIATKLFLPPLRPNMVSRPRLIERLNAGVHNKLTLISAPAGFGKTTLLSAWLAGVPRPAGWLSLDEGENDPTRFLTYLIAALQTIAAHVGGAALSALQSSQPPPSETVLTVLLNEITTIPYPFILVLDDYHVIDAQLVDQALTFLVEHKPSQMHLVIATREDPPLPLARLRARSQLTELRAADLRFSAIEAAAFLTQVMGLSLAAADVARLSDRTEGWITGLQLAALSLQDHQDVPEFIQTFAGDHRYIVDYLVEEVLQRQPEAVRRFLLQTSILDRLSGPLCDAVTGWEEGQARLEALERGNFFVVPLDGIRQWYRYHHLFADVLFTHVMADMPDQVSTLHRRASIWYEQQGETANAIRHALAAQEFERAADLIEMELPAMRRTRQDALLLGWFRLLPGEVLHTRPVLNVGYAYALLSDGKLTDALTRLQDAEQWLDASERQAEFSRLLALIAIYRAACAQMLGNIVDTVKYARLALERLQEEEHPDRLPEEGGAAEALLGLASWASGDLETAYRVFADSMARVQMAGYVSDTISGTLALADIRIAQGRLHEAMRLYARSVQLTVEQGEPVPRGTADLYVGMSELHREQNDLRTATQLLLQSKELSEHAGIPYNRSRWCVAMARVQEAQGDLNGALELLQQAERWYARDFFPNVHPLPALKVRMWVAQGRLGEALSWAREQGLDVADDLSYLREFEHITLARIFIARYKSDHSRNTILAARELLERLLQAAEGGGRLGSALEILVLLALSHQAQGDIRAALMTLERALTLAEPEGYVRMFVDEGQPMQILLEAAAHQGGAPNYARQLLTTTAVPQDETPTKLKMLGPLSARERDVLRLLETDLSGPNIARELVVSLNTVRTHTQNIYGKLGVSSRRAAVRRAQELHLL